jgi:hypothetical protein
VLHPLGIEPQILTLQDPSIFGENWPGDVQVKLLADGQIQDRCLKTVFSEQSSDNDAGVEEDTDHQAADLLFFCLVRCSRR